MKFVQVSIAQDREVTVLSAIDELGRIWLWDLFRGWSLLGNADDAQAARDAQMEDRA